VAGATVSDDIDDVIWPADPVEEIGPSMFNSHYTVVGGEIGEPIHLHETAEELFDTYAEASAHAHERRDVWPAPYRILRVTEVGLVRGPRE